MLAINFTKMHGLKNSFIIVEDFSNHLTTTLQLSSLAKIFTSPAEGIGADGLVLLKPPLIGENDYDLEMVIFNPDGSEAKMCGNAIRCLAKYVYDKKIIKKKKLVFKTKSGLIKTNLLKNQNPAALVKVDMGVPKVIRSFKRRGSEYFLVSMGNLHLIKLVKDFDFNYLSEAKELQKDEAFAGENVNVEFVKLNSTADKIFLRVIEAGVGETLACGTGACATAALFIQKGWVARKRIMVDLLGGELEIIWSEGKNLFMIGEATRVAEGTFLLTDEAIFK